VVLANDPRDKRGPGSGGHRRCRAEQCDQHHDGDDSVHEDQRNRACHLDQSGAHEQPPGVVGVDQAAHRAGKEEQRNNPGGEQQADLVRPGAVGLQAEGQGDECDLIAERRDHPS
jgi:hypothetical protein